MDNKKLYHLASMAEYIREGHQQEAFRYMADKLEQEQYCAHFGCGKVLTMTEQLYGSLCHEHSVEPKQDITKHLNY